MQRIHIDSFSPEINEAYSFITTEKPGSDRIMEATHKKGAMQTIFNLLNKGPSAHVLEFGSGIGTFDYLILKNFPDAFIDTYEDNDFCQRELDKNLAPFHGRYKVFTDQENFDCSFDSYDLIIVDGNWFKAVPELVNKARANNIFFDGVRYDMRLLFLKALKKKYVCQYSCFSHIDCDYYLGFMLSCRPEKNPIKRWFNYIQSYLLTIRYDMEKRGLSRIWKRTKKWIKKKFLKIGDNYSSK